MCAVGKRRVWLALESDEKEKEREVREGLRGRDGGSSPLETERQKDQDVTTERIQVSSHLRRCVLILRQHKPHSLLHPLPRPCSSQTFPSILGMAWTCAPSVRHRTLPTSPSSRAGHMRRRRWLVVPTMRLDPTPSGAVFPFTPRSKSTCRCCPLPPLLVISCARLKA